MFPCTSVRFSQASQRVTDAAPGKPDPADWLMWRRTLDPHGFSPLVHINRENADSLRVVRVTPRAEGAQKGTAPVDDGIM